MVHAEFYNLDYKYSMLSQSLLNQANLGEHCANESIVFTTCMFMDPYSSRQFHKTSTLDQIYGWKLEIGLLALGNAGPWFLHWPAGPWFLQDALSPCRGSFVAGFGQ